MKPYWVLQGYNVHIMYITYNVYTIYYIYAYYYSCIPQTINAHYKIIPPPIFHFCDDIGHV